MREPMEEQPLSVRGLRKSQWDQMKWYLSWAVRWASLCERYKWREDVWTSGKRLGRGNRSKRQWEGR
jgi:hypothetical protein